jgi:hypothetical protein
VFLVEREKKLKKLLDAGALNDRAVAWRVTIVDAIVSAVIIGIVFAICLAT